MTRKVGSILKELWLTVKVGNLSRLINAVIPVVIPIGLLILLSYFDLVTTDVLLNEWKVTFDSAVILCVATIFTWTLARQRSNSHLAQVTITLVKIDERKIIFRICNESKNNYSKNVSVAMYIEHENLDVSGSNFFSDVTAFNLEEPFMLRHQNSMCFAGVVPYISCLNAFGTSFIVNQIESNINVQVELTAENLPNGTLIQEFVIIISSGIINEILSKEDFVRRVEG